MRYIKEFILVLIVIFAVNSIAAERKEVVVPDSIKAEDYARFITERVDRTAQYLVDHERKMPQMTIEKHQSAVDSLKYVFKLYRSDIEDLPAFNGSSKFRKSAIKTITDIIALLGDDFPDLHKAAKDILDNKSDMSIYNEKHAKIMKELADIQSVYIKDNEQFLLENHIFQTPIPYDSRMNMSDMEETVEDFLSVMNSTTGDLVHFFTKKRLLEIQALSTDVFSYHNFNYSFQDIDPEFGVIQIKLSLNDKPASYDIWFRVESQNGVGKIIPSGFRDNKIIPWIYIRHSQIKN